jgi:hypothetical protein
MANALTEPLEPLKVAISLIAYKYFLEGCIHSHEGLGIFAASMDLVNAPVRESTLKRVIPSPFPDPSTGLV